MDLEQETFPVEITPEALTHLKRLLQKKGEGFIRLGVKGGGCSGMEYVLRVDTQKLPGDLETILEDMLMVCDPKSARFLQGSRLVYAKNLIGSGFQFENPNAQRRCGCGTSFTPKL
jgi:iron-sulfur cluster assembly protein